VVSAAARSAIPVAAISTVAAITAITTVAASAEITHGAIPGGLGFGHDDFVTQQFRTVEFQDGGLRFSFMAHVHKPEAAAFAGAFFLDGFGALHAAVLGEHGAQGVGFHIFVQVSYIKHFTHLLTPVLDWYSRERVAPGAPLGFPLVFFRLQALRRAGGTRDYRVAR
jgi:hypothetical protein